MKAKHIVVGLISHPDATGTPRYIVTKRKAGTHLAGAWELPGGKVQTDETPEMALHREIHEELGISIEEIAPLTFSHHHYEDLSGGTSLLLLFFRASSVKGATPHPLAADEMALLTLPELLALPFPPANAPLMSLLETFHHARITP